MKATPGRQRRLDDLRTENFVVAKDGRVLVHRCYPLRTVNDRPTPFPTLYWLADEALVKEVSHIEREGWIRNFQERIANHAEAREVLTHQHHSYIEDRWALLSEEDRSVICEAGLESQFRDRGIGGMIERCEVKCLHLHYAHHLASENLIGSWLEQEGLITRPEL